MQWVVQGPVPVKTTQVHSLIYPEFQWVNSSLNQEWQHSPRSFSAADTGSSPRKIELQGPAPGHWDAAGTLISWAADATKTAPHLPNWVAPWAQRSFIPHIIGQQSKARVQEDWDNGALAGGFRQWGDNRWLLFREGVHTAYGWRTAALVDGILVWALQHRCEKAQVSGHPGLA